MKKNMKFARILMDLLWNSIIVCLGIAYALVDFFHLSDFSAQNPVASGSNQGKSFAGKPTHLLQARANAR